MSVGRRLMWSTCGVAVLLCAAVWTAWTLLAVDPRARASWSAVTLQLDTTPTDVELYLPGCAIDAVTVRAASAAAAGTRLTARLSPAASAPAAGDLVRATFDADARAHLPLPALPRRERILLQMQVDAPLALDARQPFELRAVRQHPLGRLPCVVDENDRALVGWLAVTAFGLAGVGWLAGGTLAWSQLPAALARRPRAAAASAVAIGLQGALIAQFLVPPFESPDELAHVQYVRYVATTGTLPSAVPTPGSEWQASAYEWVQQPLYYLFGAALLRTVGTPSAAPVPAVHPQSRLVGGPDVNLYRHPDVTSPAAALRDFRWLRALSLLFVGMTLYCGFTVLTVATGSVALATVATAAVGLVPQWGAVMGSVSTDPPATCAAALAMAFLARATQAPAQWRWSAAAGLTTGLAYATKVTSVFLLPVALVVLSGLYLRHRHAAIRHAAWFAALALIGAAWVPLRALVVFGDPLARQFKRDVLTQGGFHVTEGPPLLSAAFLHQMQTMVFEPFWARFGSLGAGPLPGTRLWWLYGVVTSGLIAALAWGALVAWRRVWRRPADLRGWLGLASVAGVVTGLVLWAWINLVPRADVVVHWTPRHLLPLTVPLLVVTALGVQHLDRTLPGRLQHVLRLTLALALLALGVASLAVWRSVVLGFHFGY